MKINRTRYLFSIERYPALFGYIDSKGNSCDEKHVDVVVIRILGLEITFTKRRKDLDK